VASKRQPRTETEVLIIDDEPEYLLWLFEFIESLGYKPEVRGTLAGGLAALREKRYRVVIVDMEIPAGGAIADMTRRHSPVAEIYPGIVAATTCRNQGYDRRQVFAYSVHDDSAADAELSKLDCEYVLKGRPEAIKRAIRFSLGLPMPARVRVREDDDKED
jgi:CheY-like chemotaxis protein